MPNRAPDRKHAVTHRVRIVAHAGRMREQMAQTHGFRVGQVVEPFDPAQPFRRRIVEREHTVLDQQQRQRGNESLPGTPARHAHRIVERHGVFHIRQPHRGADYRTVREPHRGAQSGQLHFRPRFLKQGGQFRPLQRKGRLKADQRRDQEACSHGQLPGSRSSRPSLADHPGVPECNDAVEPQCFASSRPLR